MVVDVDVDVDDTPDVVVNRPKWSPSPKGWWEGDRGGEGVRVSTTFARQAGGWGPKRER